MGLNLNVDMIQMWRDVDIDTYLDVDVHRDKQVDVIVT